MSECSSGIRQTYLDSELVFIKPGSGSPAAYFHGLLNRRGSAISTDVDTTGPSCAHLKSVVPAFDGCQSDVWLIRGVEPCERRGRIPTSASRFLHPATFLPISSIISMKPCRLSKEESRHAPFGTHVVTSVCHRIAHAYC